MSETIATAPWFAGGLRFGCTQCGACCTGEPGYVWVTHEEIRRLAEFLELPLRAFVRRYLRRVRKRVGLREKKNGDCVFFERPSGHCRIYPIRPVQCRTYPFWPEVLRSKATWEEESEHCPGIGRGKRWPAERCADLAAESRRAVNRTARKFPTGEDRSEPS